VRSLEREIATIEDQLVTLDKRIDRLTPTTGTSPSDTASPSDMAKLGAAERSRDTLTRRLGQLQGELVAIQGQRALRPQAGVIDPATSARPLPGRRLPDLLLGGLLGLIAGMAAAAGRESVAPTVVGHAALARALGAPVLADLPQPPDRCTRKDVAVAARHVELAAAGSGVARIELMSLEPAVDTRRFTEYLDDELTSELVHGMELLSQSGRPATTRSGWADSATRTDRRISSNGGSDERRTGLVVIVPDAVRLSALEPVRNLLSITGWPLVGIVVFRRNGRYLPPRVPKNREPADRPARLPEPLRQGNGASA
jgi:hypothetical protein